MVGKPAHLENLRALARRNTWFRHAAHTATYWQVLLMSLSAGEETGDEVLALSDQVLLLTEGEGVAFLDGQRIPLDRQGLLLIPAGTRHNIRNTGLMALKLVALHAPPTFADGTIHRTLEDAIGSQPPIGAAALRPDPTD